MIVDQLFENNKKPLNEVDPRNFDSDEDYRAAKNSPVKRRSAPSDYPYSSQEDDAYFNDIFRKKREAAKKAAQDKEQGASDDQVYESFYKVGRMLSERKMSEKEILDVFAQAEQGMTDKDTGANRTALGRGKDITGKAVTSAKDSINKVLDSIQNSTPVAGVDVAYDQATDALANAVGNNSKVMDSIKKYRLLAKEYPKTQLFVKTALIALAGLATGGAGLPVIAGLTAAVDSAIKGEKLSSMIGKGTGAGLMGLGAQEVSSMLSGTDSAAASADVSSGTGQFQLPDADAAMNSQADIDAAREWINGDEETRTDIEQVTGMSAAQLQDIAVANDLANSTGSGTIPGMGGGQYEVVKGDQLGYIAQANGVSVEDIKGLNPQIDFAKPLQPGMTIELPPTGDGAGSVWQGYNSGVYGDKAAMSQSQADTLSGRADNIANMTQQAGDATPVIDYTKPGPESMDSLGQKLEYGIPVNDQGSFIPPNPDLPASELAKQTSAYNTWKSDFMKRFPDAVQGADGVMQGNTMQILQKPTLPAEVQESIRYKIIPAEQLIDQKLTVLNWALLESVNRKSNSVSLTNKGVYAVFENVDRCRKAIVEYTQPGREQIPNLLRPDAPGAPVPQTAQPGLIGRGLNALDRGVKKVGGALSNFGHQFTTGVTKEKLKMNWHQKGKLTDSEQLADFLVQQGVPQQVVVDVYGKMGIPGGPLNTPSSVPVSASVSRSMPWIGTNPATGKAWTAGEIEQRSISRQNKELAATLKADAKDVAISTEPLRTLARQELSTATAPFTAAQPTTAAGGPGFNTSNVMSLPGMEKYAKKPAATTAKPNFAQQGGGYAQVKQPATVKYNMPGATKPAAAPAPTGTRVVSGGPTPDEQAKLAQRIAQAAKQPVAEMLSMVETNEDVAKIKQFIDQTFVKYGAVSESAFIVRNRLIEHVTQVGAQRRREYARKS